MAPAKPWQSPRGPSVHCLVCLGAATRAMMFQTVCLLNVPESVFVTWRYIYVFYFQTYKESTGALVFTEMKTFILL